MTKYFSLLEATPSDLSGTVTKKLEAKNTMFDIQFLLRENTLNFQPLLNKKS